MILYFVYLVFLLSCGCNSLVIEERIDGIWNKAETAVIFQNSLRTLQAAEYFNDLYIEQRGVSYMHNTSAFSVDVPMHEVQSSHNLFQDIPVNPSFDKWLNTSSRVSLQESIRRGHGTFAQKVVEVEGKIVLPESKFDGLWRFDRRGNAFTTTIHKLDHDADQMEYLIQSGLLPADGFTDLIRSYRAVANVIRLSAISRGAFFVLTSAMAARLKYTYNTNIYHPFPVVGRGGLGTAGGMGIDEIYPEQVLNPAIDWGKLQGQFLALLEGNGAVSDASDKTITANGANSANSASSARSASGADFKASITNWTEAAAAAASASASASSDHHHQNSSTTDSAPALPLPLIVIDNFLTAAALRELQEFVLTATVYHEVKPGYLGAYMTDGFVHPVLLRLEHDLRANLPALLEGLALKNMWSYKHDAEPTLRGVSIHADLAYVNLNFWVTPDDANLDPTSGGLIVYDKLMPRGGGKDDWNDFAMEGRMKEWLLEQRASMINIPHRCNRVVLFASTVLHESAPFKFRPGYRNRRVNITYLFGKMA